MAVGLYVPLSLNLCCKFQLAIIFIMVATHLCILFGIEHSNWAVLHWRITVSRTGRSRFCNLCTCISVWDDQNHRQQSEMCDFNVSSEHWMHCRCSVSNHCRRYESFLPRSHHTFLILKFHKRNLGGATPHQRESGYHASFSVSLHSSRIQLSYRDHTHLLHVARRAGYFPRH